ncbi:MAG: C10 family peptidase, partial [Bacteroidales bacterium]|nr:C10 family peptidase [Bacteroidales bacterium]
MKKTLLLASFFLLSSFILTSAPIDTALSKRVAANFYRERIGSDASTREVSPLLVKTYKAAPRAERGDSLICLFIYNIDNGFVIVSGDDRVMPVLGYSTEGQFIPQNMPIQLQEWLLGYAAEIESVMNTPTFVNSEAAASWSRLGSPNFTPSRYGAVVVQPLIQTCWNQSPYYNDLCPLIGNERTVTGCVATAMAQMLWYWKYPTHGFGSYSYTHPTCGVQSADFAAATYNYDLMPTSLDNNSSATEVFEVAQLMYHCGVSVHMDYGTGGSSASLASAAYAFNTYFGYSCTHRERSSVGSDAQWISDIKAELDNARPVLYRGHGNGVGHAFICDGYTVDNYFHFNWGWGCAYQNVYLTLDHIEPGNNQFNDGQAAIFNMSAATPILLTNTNSLNFFTENSAVTEGRKVNVLTHSLTNNITITTSSPFAVSLDSVNYSTSITLGTGGGNFYVRYQPAPGNHNDVGTIALASGSMSASIDLQGLSCTITCTPPQDLGISSNDLQHIHLFWSSPQADQTEQTLSWNDGNLSTSYSYGYNQLTLLQRFTEADLISHHGKSLTKISSYIINGATLLKLVVFKGGSYSGSSIEPGTLVHEQSIPISSVSQGAWNTFNLSTPVPVDASQELWFGIYMESTAAYPIAVGPTYTPQKGAIIGLEAMGASFWIENVNYSLCIQGTLQNVQTVSHYEVSRDGIVLGNTSNTYYDDVVNATSTYHYDVAAVWSNGCSSSTSIAITNIASIYAYPTMLTLHNNGGFNIQVKKTFVSSMGLSSNIQATVTSPFQISTDSINFSTSKTLPATGGALYVRYNPTTYPAAPEHGNISLTSGSATAQVQLVGQGTGDCNPPQNLTLSVSSSGTTVTATWDAPDALSVNTHNLSWHRDNVNSYTRFYSTTLYALQRFESSDLAPYHNKKITSISFIPFTNSLTSCKVVVFKGGAFTSSYKNPGTLVAEQEVPISSISNWTWNTVTLNTPITIDANQELWFGVYMTFSGEYSNSPGLGTPVTTDKSAIYGYGTTWNSYNNYSFAIKASVEDNNPIFDHYQIDRNGSTLVNSTTLTSYLDNVAVTGDYTVWAVWSDGCQSGVSGSVTVASGCTAPGTVDTHDQCGGTYTWHGTTYNTSGTYTYAFMNSNNCHQVDTLRLNIHSAPSVSISGNSSTCSGASTMLTATGASSYSWSTGASGSSITVNPTSTTTYTVTGTDSHGCTGNATITVSVIYCIPGDDAQPCLNSPTVTDYDGNVYNTVKIGNQCWMKENLRTTHYANGDNIALSSGTMSLTDAYRYLPNNSSSTVGTYGYLYNWAAAMHGSLTSNSNPSDVQGICPNGWHLPSDTEWVQLMDYVSSQNQFLCGEDSAIARSLAATTGWDAPYWNDDTCTVGYQPSLNNATGFSALPAGYFDYQLTYIVGQGLVQSELGTGQSFGDQTIFWCSTEHSATHAYYRGLSSSFSTITGGGFAETKEQGISVRCIRDLNGSTSTLPSVTTGNVTSVTASSASCGGNVTADGGAAVVARGVCWSTSHNPTVADAHTTNGTGTGTFTSSITGLTPNTTYYVRAYATNSVGTAYGNEVTFTTENGIQASDAQPCTGIPTVTDYDGNVYNTVRIGNQCWMKENLRTKHYADGSSISAGTTTSSTTAYRYNPGNNFDNVSAYGYLYNWAAVMHGSSSSDANSSEVQGICPTGWHVPSNAEWTQLTDYVGSVPAYQCSSNSAYIAKALAASEAWNSNISNCAVGNGLSNNNATGFSALPAGLYQSSHNAYFGDHTGFWSSTEGDYGNYWGRNLSYNDSYVTPSTFGKSSAHSVRCVLDSFISLSIVTTAMVTNIAQISATCGGNVIADGGATVSARGICWSTSQNPTVADTHTMDGTGTGAFTSHITGLTPNTTYYVRAYATNSAGTAYGEQEIFTTESNAQPCTGNPTVTDYDGNVYNTVKIGNQCWMKENLRTTRSADGTPVSYFSTYGGAQYGHLYSWDNMMRGAASSSSNPSGVQGICPNGWHVPSDAEWSQLTNYVSNQSQYVCGNDNSNIAKSLASKTGWNSSAYYCAIGNNPNANNATGFSALPAGDYYNDGEYISFGYVACFWSSTQYNSTYAWERYLYNGGETVNRYEDGKSDFHSVRCLRNDSTTATLPTVTTDPVSDITATSVTCGGNVTADGGAAVAARGVCWSTSQNPTVADAHTTDGTGTGAFTSS